MGSIRRRVAAALRFIDTVTQTPVPGSSLYIQIRQKSPIIRKDDGYVVILSQSGVDSLDIDVSGAGFLAVTVHMNLVQEAAAVIQYIYLLPSLDYPFTPQMAVISGTCTTRGLYAVRAVDSSRYRLMEDIAKGMEMIRIWGSEKFLQGQRLLLNEGEQYALVTLLESDDETEYGYRIQKPAAACFHKGKTTVYSVIRISPDKSGRFCAAYDKISKDGEIIRFLGDHFLGHEGKANAGTEIDTQVRIQEGQEIEIHVGG